MPHQPFFFPVFTYICYPLLGAVYYVVVLLMVVLQHDYFILQVKGPYGEQIYDSRDKSSDKFEFTANRNGLHTFCFTNKSPYHETIDFDLHVVHYYSSDQHAKDG